MHRLIAALTVLGGLALSATAHATSTFDFTLTGVGGNNSSGFFSGSGTFIADPTGSLGNFQISDITGTNITGLIQPGGFNGNDDLVNPSAMDFLDPAGFAFTYQDVSGIDSADIFQNQNGTFAYVQEADGDTTTVPVTFTVGTVGVTPEPSSIVLLATGLLGIAGVFRRRLLPA
jgi:hypothetical protein